jgi:hypothetical protein
MTLGKAALLRMTRRKAAILRMTGRVRMAPKAAVVLGLAIALAAGCACSPPSFTS